MEIILNGQKRLLTQTITVADLVQQMGYAGKRVAVEVNTAIVPRSRYGEIQLQASDRVEIVQAIGGG